MLSNSKIPKIIHQTWKTKDIPKKYKKWQNSWKKHHPDWEYRLWDDTDLRNLIKNEYPWFLEKYDNYPHMIQRVDAARGFILHKYGGLYVDLDYEAFISMDDALNNKESVYITSNVNKNEKLQNSLMASKPNHKFFEYHNKELLEQENKNTMNITNDIFETAGPLFLKKIYENYKDNNDDIKLLDLEYNNGPKAKHHCVQSWIWTNKNYLLRIILGSIFIIFSVILIILISITKKK